MVTPPPLPVQINFLPFFLPWQTLQHSLVQAGVLWRAVPKLLHFDISLELQQKANIEAAAKKAAEAAAAGAAAALSAEAAAEASKAAAAARSVLWPGLLFFGVVSSAKILFWCCCLMFICFGCALSLPLKK